MVLAEKKVALAFGLNPSRTSNSGFDSPCSYIDDAAPCLPSH